MDSFPGDILVTQKPLNIDVEIENILFTGGGVEFSWYFCNYDWPVFPLHFCYSM